MMCFTTAQKVAYAVGFVMSIAVIPLVIGLPMLYYLARRGTSAACLRSRPNSSPASDSLFSFFLEPKIL